MLLERRAVQFFVAALLLNVLGPVAAASAADPNPGTVIEVLISNENTVEIICPTAECNAKCRDIDQVLVAGTYYQLGANCSLVVTDGALLNEALEALLAVLGDEVVPGGPGQGQGLSDEPPGFPNAEANPSQQRMPPASGLRPGGVGDPG